MRNEDVKIERTEEKITSPTDLTITAQKTISGKWCIYDSETHRDAYVEHGDEAEHQVREWIRVKYNETIEEQVGRSIAKIASELHNLRRIKKMELTDDLNLFLAMKNVIMFANQHAPTAQTELAVASIYGAEKEARAKAEEKMSENS